MINCTFIEAVGDISNEEAEKPLSITNMKQRFSHIHYGQQGWQLCKKTQTAMNQ